MVVSDSNFARSRNFVAASVIFIRFSITYNYFCFQLPYIYHNPACLTIVLVYLTFLSKKEKKDEFELFSIRSFKERKEEKNFIR